MEKYTISKQGLQVTDAELEITEIVLKPESKVVAKDGEGMDVEPITYISMRYRTAFKKDGQSVPYPHNMDMHYMEIPQAKWDELVQLAVTDFKSKDEVSLIK
jgi:hypothetical protein